MFNSMDRAEAILTALYWPRVPNSNVFIVPVALTRKLRDKRIRAREGYRWRAQLGLD